MLKRLGVFDLGSRPIRVEAVTGQSGGWFSTNMGDDIAVVSIGIDYQEWAGVLNVLMHELMEFALHDLCCRFRLANEKSDASDLYRFIADHSQFSEATARAAIVVSQVYVPLLDFYVKTNKKKK